MAATECHDNGLSNGFSEEGVHQYLVRYIRRLDDLSGKRVLDIPCGEGRATWEFRRKNAEVIALDLFPEFLRVADVEARYADLTEPLPVESASVDYVVCEEGIEHVPNQLAVLEEFNRVLRPGGRLLLTTPNDSHLRARIARLLFETDLWKRMPPTELDSVWFANDASDKLYLGHLFLVSVQHLQSLATFSGFQVTNRYRTTIGKTSVALTMAAYPLLVLASLATYLAYRRKNRHVAEPVRKKILWERVKLNLSLKTLCCKHIFWELTKVESLAENRARLKRLVRRAA